MDNVEMSEDLRQEKSMHIVDTLMINRLDKPFKNVEDVSNWMIDIENLFGSVLSYANYNELLNYGLDNIKYEE